MDAFPIRHILQPFRHIFQDIGDTLWHISDNPPRALTKTLEILHDTFYVSFFSIIAIFTAMILIHIKWLLSLVSLELMDVVVIVIYISYIITHWERIWWWITTMAILLFCSALVYMLVTLLIWLEVSMSDILLAIVITMAHADSVVGAEERMWIVYILLAPIAVSLSLMVAAGKVVAKVMLGAVRGTLVELQRDGQDDDNKGVIEEARRPAGRDVWQQI